jgi:predicted metal-dependent peptidase
MESTMNEETIEEKARTVLRKYLKRCHKTISADYPEIANMPPENAADYLIHLRDTGKIIITLDTVGSQVECQIENLDRQQ